MPIPVAIAAARIAARAKALKGGSKPSGAGTTPALLSVEGVAMLFTALAVDFIPPIFIFLLDLNPFLPGAGEFISPVIDVFATITLGGWMFLRSGGQGAGGKLMQFIKKRGALIGLEYVPVVGEGPWWTINVYMFLKK